MKLRRLGSVVALGWALAITVGAAAQGAQTVNATVAAGSYPIAVAVNPATNKIYVANQGGNVTVIDGATNATATIAAGKYPQAVAVNPATNKIYVANGDSNNVTVINGATNATATIAAGTHPIAVAVNRVTDKIYVPNFRSNNVTVIDGAKSTTAKVAAAPTASTNLITNGDFESGNTGFTSGYAFGNVHGPGTYWIGGTPSQAPGAWGGWYNGGDHTSGSGKMMVVNGANDALLPV